MTVVLFLAVLFVLVFVHELGHFAVAKWTKMRVDEFAIGFPPRLFSKKKGETSYTLNILPIGGYVRIFGENGTEDPGQINTADRSRAFGTRPRLHQAAVLIAGVAMNILAAWVIFYAVAIIGTPVVMNEGTTEETDLIVTAVLDDSAASKAAIPLGAEITAVRAGADSLDTFTPTAFSTFIADHSTEQIILDYTNSNTEYRTALNAEAGVIEAEPGREVVGLATALVGVVKEGPLTALVTATERTVNGLYAITVGISSLFVSIFTFSADLDSVTGPVGIATMVGDAAEFGVVSLLVFTAFISLNLAVINLLPIPALDGGRLVFVAIEAVIRRPIDPKWMTRVNLIGFAFLILLMLLVTYKDVINL